MAKYGSVDLTITIEDSVGAPQDLSADINSIDGVEIEALIEETTAFGVEWTTQLATGIKQGNAVTLGGFYDDAASGTDAVLQGIGDVREVVITYGGGKTTTFDAIIQSYKRLPVNKELHKFSCVLLPTGEVVEA